MVLGSPQRGEPKWSPSRNLVDELELLVAEVGVLQRADVVENLLRLGGSGQHGGHFAVVQQPCQAHLGQRLAAFGGQIVQIHDLLVQFLGQSGIVEESRIVSHAAVGRNAVEIAVGQQALSQRAEGDKAFAQLEGGLFQAVLFNGAVEDVVLVLVDDEYLLNIPPVR